MNVHKVLYVPRNLHMEVHKVLRLERNLHLEAHKVLHLPRNVHLDVHNVLCPPRKLRMDAHRFCVCHEICTSRNKLKFSSQGKDDSDHARAKSENDPRSSPTRCSAELDLPDSEPPVPLKNIVFYVPVISPKCILYCACHEICTSRFTKCYACHEICLWRFTKYCVYHEILPWRFAICYTHHKICA